MPPLGFKVDREEAREEERRRYGEREREEEGAVPPVESKGIKDEYTKAARIYRTSRQKDDSPSRGMLISTWWRGPRGTPTTPTQ